MIRNLFSRVVSPCLLFSLVTFVAGVSFAQTVPHVAGVGRHVTRPDRESAEEARRNPGVQRFAQSVASNDLQAIPKPTRTTFMASWAAVTGATGYRLDVSTDNQFRSFLPGYQNLDAGGRTNWTVTRLQPGTSYYYRVRATTSAGVVSTSPVNNAVTAQLTGLTINATFDTSITSSPNAAVIEATINQIVTLYETLFTDPITITILYRYSTTAPDGGPLGPGNLAQSNFVVYGVTWDEYIVALRTDAKTTNDSLANASLPATAITTDILPSSANGRSVGLDTPPFMDATGQLNPAGPYDGIVTLNAAEPFAFNRPIGPGDFDAISSIEHEMDEVMGLGSFIDAATDFRPQDLFSWHAPGDRNYSAISTRYFSIDSGVTNIVGFNQDPSGDFGDWLSGSCPAVTPHVQDAFGCPGQSPDITSISPEGINLDVIGYDLVTIPTHPYGEIISPVPSTVLPSSTVPFVWTAGTAKAYLLLIGDDRVHEPGGSNLFTSGQTGGHTNTVRNLPTDGRRLYARLYSLVNGTWYNPPQDYIYTAQALGVLNPVIAPASGTYHKKVTVNMATGTPGAAIHYTLTGATPTAASPLFTGTFTLTTSKTVKAIATHTGVPNSSVVTATYTVLPR